MTLRVNEETFRTATIQNDLNPVWNDESFSFELATIEGQTLLVDVFDSDQGEASSSGPDITMGKLRLSVEDLIAAETSEQTFSLVDEAQMENWKGRISLSIAWRDARGSSHPPLPASPSPLKPPAY